MLYALLETTAVGERWNVMPFLTEKRYVKRYVIWNCEGEKAWIFGKECGEREKLIGNGAKRPEVLLERTAAFLQKGNFLGENWEKEAAKSSFPCWMANFTGKIF